MYALLDFTYAAKKTYRNQLTWFSAPDVTPNKMSAVATELCIQWSELSLDPPPSFLEIKFYLKKY